MFDAQWSDPHVGLGSQPSPRGKVAVSFGEDITHRFLDEAGLVLCIRSHRVPKSGHGYEFEHGNRLLTLFSASNYGGVLHNRGAVGVIRRSSAAGIHAVDSAIGCYHSGGSSSSSSSNYPHDRRSPSARPLTKRLRKLILSICEHDVQPAGLGVGPGAFATPTFGAKTTACTIRRIVEQHVRDQEADTLQHGAGLICSERDELWRRCRALDVSGTGIVSQKALLGILEEVCGELGWPDFLQSVGVADTVAYGEFLAVPQVRWFNKGSATQVIAMAQATAEAELQLGGLITPQLARRALQRLLPSLREEQLVGLTQALFGNDPVELSTALHQLALFADKPRFSEPWMQPALQRLAVLVQKSYGPPPLHAALMRFFRRLDSNRNDLVSQDEFVAGIQKLLQMQQGQLILQQQHQSFSPGQLMRLFDAVDGNRTGTICFLELLLAMDERTQRPVLPEFPALEGAVPSMLYVHKAAVLQACRTMDTLETGCITVPDFLALVEALAEVVGRPLTAASRAALAKVLGGNEDLAYMEALGTFEVSACGEAWHWPND